MNRKILVTGATSGFGKAIATIFARHGDDVIITGRRNDRLEELCRELESKYNVAVYTLCFDVRHRAEVEKAVSSLPDDWKKIDVLVNNAGLALGRDHFDEADVDDWDRMIDTNVKGLLYVSKAVLPYMTVRGKGHVINIGSTAAKEVYEKGNIYCASKSAVESITQSMRIDLLKHNIKVTAVHPGAAETEFSLVRFKGDEATAKSVYQGFEPLRAEDVAEVVFYCASLPAHVCINDLVMSSTQQANSFYFNRK
jgi:NADP-dependent 3-hydroxy acid dehydrogenase YdfG